jgi:ribonuclease P protein component
MVPVMIPFPQPHEPLRTASETPTVRDARLRKHADYQRVYQATRKQFSTSMTWFLAQREASVLTSDGRGGLRAIPGDCPRVGLTVGKVLGKAHERNRIKRRLREVVRRHLHELPEGVDLILHPKRLVMEMEFVKLDAEVLRIFRQAAARCKTARPVEVLGPIGLKKP